MAYVLLSGSSSAALLYLIEHPVGLGCTNQRNDVLLVQFFLKVASEGPDRTSYAPPGRAAITCDGAWGPNSQAYLNQYLAGNARFNPTLQVKQDGRVDPVATGKPFSPGGTFYSILALNTTYWNARGKPFMNDISKDPLFPKALGPCVVF